MFGWLFAEVYEITKYEWIPKKEYSNEHGYRDDLTTFLKEKLNSPQNPLIGVSRGRVEVKNEDGRGLCDVGVDERIGIELKKDFRKKRDIDTLNDQIIRYKRYYEDIIVVLVGCSYPDAKENLGEIIKDLSGSGVGIGDGIGLSQEPRVKVIDKTFECEDEYED